MAYFPGHKYFLKVAPSGAQTISNSTGAITNAPAIGTAHDIGYLSPNDVTINENTTEGFASGREGAIYHKKGWREISLAPTLRVGSGAFLADYCLPQGAPPPVDFFYGISGAWARQIHLAKCAGVGLEITADDNAEITATARFEGVAYSSISPITFDYDYEEFGPALRFSDMKTFNIGALDLVGNVMGLSVETDRQIERKNGRRDFGDNVPGSRTAFELLTHHKTIGGTLTLHDLPGVEPQLFMGAVNSMQWSDIVVEFEDITTGTKFDITITDPRPVARTQNEIESSGQMNWSIPFVASGLVVTPVAGGGGGDG